MNPEESAKPTHHTHHPPSHWVTLLEFPGLHAPCAWILVEAAAYRNARTLQRSDAPLLQLRAELQELLNEQKGQSCWVKEVREGVRVGYRYRWACRYR